MKKIIDGKRYDTDTAELICLLSCDAYAGAWDWHCTTLYRTKNGAYFLEGFGEGGSMWGRKLYDCNEYVSGEGLRVLTSEEALHILEENDETDVIEKYFKVEDA
ncbi:MAG: hypothetical protein ABS75_04480 [Pelagibacterium sp. SCN 63-23]|nr:MAG: hypothetical protein ABS75_04480 [Pelagibacterium sp. SCN 63-23]